MLRLILITLIIVPILNEETVIDLSEGQSIEKNLESTSPQIYEVKYSGNKQYIEVNVISTKNNPYIIFCQKKECNFENAYLISNMRELEHSLFIKKNYLLNNVGYIHIFSYEDSITGKVIFKDSDMMILKKDSSFSFYNPNDNNENLIKLNIEKDDKSIMTLSVFIPNIEKNSVKFYYYDGTKKDELKDSFSFDYGNAITIDQSKYQYVDNSYFLISITSTKNSYIILNSKTFNNQNSKLTANTLPYQGIINDNLKNQCFEINTKSNYNSDLTLHFHIMSLKGNIIYYFSEDQKETTVIYDDAFVKSINDLTNNKICFKSNDIQSAYYIEIVNLNEESKKTDFFTPQINGYTYKRIIPKKSLIYYNFAKRSGDKNDYITFYLRFQKGKPNMYKGTCKTFPKCIFSYDKIQEYISEGSLINGKNMNNIYTYSFKLSVGIEIINPNQDLLFVSCDENEDCEFETLIFGKEDNIYLKSNQRIAYVVPNGMKNNYIFNITDKNVNNVTFSVYTFTGDNKVQSMSSKENYLNTYFYVNKQEFVYTISDITKEDLLGRYYFSVESKSNSFYSIEYETFSATENKTIVNAGMTYVEILDINEKMDLYVNLLRKKSLKSNYYASFFALNCKVTITKLYSSQIILNKDFFTIDEILTTDKEYNEDYIKYSVVVNEMDSTLEKNQEPCMLYIASVENNYIKGSTDIEGSILIGENVLQRVVLTEKTKGIKYIYPYTVTEKGNLLFTFESINQPSLTVQITIENNKTNFIVSTSKTYVLTKEDNPCSETGKICNVLVDITAEKEEDLSKEIKFTFTIKSEEEFPSYIKKGLMKTDVISGKSFVYYYTDVVLNEEGEINVNFERGTGDVYARLVKKDIIEENANWMGRFHLPKKGDDNLLIVNDYSHKIYYFKSDSKICVKGCFLLITVENSVSRIIESANYLYDISIMVKVTNGKNPQVIEVPFDRFIINLIPSKEEDLNNYYHYYSFTLTSDASKILFELQSDMTVIYGYKGTKLPKYKDNDFDYNPNDPNSVFEYNKSPLKKGDKFTISIGVIRKYQSISEHIYSLRIRVIPENKIDLIPVNSDQNTLCKFETNKKYCYFSVFYRSVDRLKDVYIHVLQDKVSSLQIFAKNLSYSQTLDEKQLPREDNYDLTSKHQLNKDYLLINLLDMTQEYLIISVKSDNPGVITLLSTFYTYTESLNVDTSAYQLLHLYHESQIKLNFPYNNMYIAHFASVQGSGIITSNNFNETYELKGSFDILGVVIPIGSPTQINVTGGENEFGFYVYFEPRNVINFDEIEYGTSGVILYDESSFPLIFYTQIPINNYDNDVIVTINLKNYTLFNNDIKDNSFKSSIEDMDFAIKGYVADKDFIVKKKFDSDINPESLFDGEFDSFLKIGKVRFTKEQIKTKKNDPYLYVTLKKDKAQNKTLYKGITVEYSVLPINSNNYLAPYNQYIFGNLKYENGKGIYKLRRNHDNDKYMKIQFSSNQQDNISVSIMNSIPSDDKYKNDTVPLKNECSNGKCTFIINLSNNKNDILEFIYLIVYSNNKNAANYVLKYSSSPSENDFPIYIIDNTNVNCTHDNNSVLLSLNTISKKFKDSLSKISTTYIVKVIDKFDSNGFLGSISFMNETVHKIYTKVYDGEKDKFHMNLTDFPKDKEYYIIINAITNEDSNEIFYYNITKNPMDVEEKKDPPKNSRTPKAVIIILIIIIVGLIAGFGVLFYKMKAENADLQERINQMSGYNLANDSAENLNYNPQT